MLNLYLIMCLVPVTTSNLLHHGFHWQDIQSPIWESPAGRVFRVYNFSDINDLQTDLLPGDVMVMSVDGNWHNGRVNLSASGLNEVGYRIYLLPEVFGMVKITGDVQFVFSGESIEVRGLWFYGKSPDKAIALWFDPQSSHCRFTNSAFDDWNQDVHTYRQQWMEIWGSYHTIDFNSFEGKIGTGQLVRVMAYDDYFQPPGEPPYSWGHTIRFNYFGARGFEPEDDGEGIQLGHSKAEFVQAFNLVEGNLFEDYDGEIECISVKTSNNIVRYNTFKSSACTMTLRHSNNSVVQENYFFCNYKFGCAGVRIYGGYHHVINNYVEMDNYTTDDVWTRGGVLLFTGNSTDRLAREATNNHIENNLLVFCTHCIIANQDSIRGGDIDAENNTFIGNIMVAGNEDMYVLRDQGQISSNWKDNIAWGGIIDRIEEPEYQEGIEIMDPSLEFDESWGIWRPTHPDLEWSITFRPLNTDLVGPTWKSIGRKST